jgi:host cell surface-exposed lipoprotein
MQPLNVSPAPQPKKRKGVLVVVCTLSALLVVGCLGIFTAVLTSGGSTPSSSSRLLTDPSAAASPAAAKAKTKPKPADLERLNAGTAALEYVNSGQGFSRKGLIKQLTSEYGEGYSPKAATEAVDILQKSGVIDWNAEAVKSAKSYLDTQSFSRKGLIRQLESSYGEGFTHAQAVYGVKQAGL